jgi:hypothetical protein
MNIKLKLMLGATLVVALNFLPQAKAVDLGSLGDLLGQLRSLSKASGDSTLVSLAGDLASKAQSLYKALGGNSAIQGQLISVLQSLVGNKGISAFGALSKLSEAKLTDKQMGMVKDVGNVASAYLVQKNFSKLEGAQGDVAQVVSSLRKGEYLAALPALRNVAQNAQLTPAQKELASAMVDQYAPDVKKIGNVLKDGLKGLPAFGK